MNYRARQGGALLLMVSLVLATMAAVSFAMNRAATADSGTVQVDYESRAAAYLVDAAMATARWSNQVAGCTSSSIPQTAFGGGSFAAAVTKGSGKKLNISATVRSGNTTRTVERKDVRLVDLTETDTDDLTDGTDTAVDFFNALPNDTNETMSLYSGSAHGLMLWNLKDIKKESRILSASLRLTQYGSSAAIRQVGVHRMMMPWNPNATWGLSRWALAGGTRWTGNSIGQLPGDFGALPAASTNVTGAGTYSWDVTGLVDGWFSGRLVNHGLLLRLATPGQSVSFYSRDASENRRPILRVVSAEPC